MIIFLCKYFAFFFHKRLELPHSNSLQVSLIVMFSDHNNKSMLGMRTVYNGHTQIDSMSGTVQAPGAQM